MDHKERRPRREPPPSTRLIAILIYGPQDHIQRRRCQDRFGAYQIDFSIGALAQTLLMSRGRLRCLFSILERNGYLGEVFFGPNYGRCIFKVPKWLMEIDPKMEILIHQDVSSYVWRRKRDAKLRL